VATPKSRTDDWADFVRDVSSLRCRRGRRYGASDVHWRERGVKTNLGGAAVPGRSRPGDQPAGPIV